MQSPDAVASRPLQVFLSYSSHDAALALRLATDLRVFSIDVWLDQWELRIGETFEQSIEHGVDDAAFVIVLLTHASVASAWVRREWSRKVLEEAQQQRVGVIPVRAERCEIPDFLAQRSHADIAGGSYQLGLRRLLEILRHHSGDRGVVVPGSKIDEAELDMNTLPIVTPIALEVSHDLIPLFEKRDAHNRNRMLDEQLPAMLEELAGEFGFRFPGVRVRGNESDMPSGTAMFMIDEVPEGFLSVDASGAETVLIPQLKNVLRKCAAEFIDIDSTRTLVDALAARDPALVAAVVPRVVDWFELVDVFRRLLAEGLGIGDVAAIFAEFAHAAKPQSDTVELTELARHALRAQITARLAEGRDTLPVLRLTPEIESYFRLALQHTSHGAYLMLEPRRTQDILAAIRHVVNSIDGNVNDIPLLTTSDIRPYVRRLVELEFPRLQVVSPQDLLSGTQLSTVCEIALDAPTTTQAQPS